jgi:hypothetical protein
MSIGRKRWVFSRFSVLLLVVVLLGSLLRWGLIVHGWPITNSDEATMGIMAFHIAYRGEWPLMYYGQGYMGPIEAYLVAPIFRLWGVSLLNLRVGMVLLYGAFLVALFYFSRLLYTRRFALFVVFVLSLGSNAIFTHQLKAIGGYPELPLLATLICIVFVLILLDADRAQESCTGDIGVRKNSGGGGRSRWFAGRRGWLYTCFGFAIGFALWVDPLIFPFVLTGLGLLMVLKRREIFSATGLLLLAGFVIGIFPLLLYNAMVPFDQSTISNMAGFINPMPGKSFSLLARLAGTFFIAIPSATGYANVCSSDTSALFIGGNIPCTLTQGMWSAGYLLLWALAFVNVLRAVSRAKKGRGENTKDGVWGQVEPVRAYGSMMVLLSAAITIIVYTASSQAASLPVITARYLVCLLVSMPVVLWQLWPGKRVYSALWRRREWFVGLGKAAILVLILGVLVGGVYETFADVPAAQRFAVQQDALVRYLQGTGATRIYSEYWTCNRLIFVSREKIICGVLNEDLSVGMNRYPAYLKIVRAVARPAYVIPLKSRFEQNFVQACKRSGSLRRYRRTEYEGYAIYEMG